MARIIDIRTWRRPKGGGGFGASGSSVTVHLSPKEQKDLGVIAARHGSVPKALTTAISHVYFLEQTESAGDEVLLERPRWGVKLLGVPIFGTRTMRLRF
jgi:hypothetical protein